ncbi:hypothetical protein [Metamycoplasma salivarium]|uniref:hypothetical protein n=1 Tax=Metamycoplasma salivarium TaxID=2124 RepID=UPI001F429D9D|nr:hypothetical protein [Metamycoplasma salivarium]GIZ06989.1 hypothetical protein MSATCC33130_3430 [Metamycoplasma salivarium]
MSVSSANTTNENIDVKNLEKLLCFMNTQENTIKKIISGKGFYQKRFDTLTLEEKKNFFKEVIKNSVTTDEQKMLLKKQNNMAITTKAVMVDKIFYLRI